MDPTQKLARETFQGFRDFLSTSGYLHYYLAFGNGNMRRQEWEDHADILPERLLALVKLFLLGQSVEAGRVTELLGDGVYRALLDAEILKTEDGLTFTDQYVLVCLNSIVFFCQLNEHLAPPSVYFGHDSVALSHYHLPRTSGKVLDLCSGSAIQAMNAALHTSREVHAVEINPRAAMIARFNLYLNGLEDRVTVFNASAEEYAKQDDNTYSLILFNPPFAPIPKSEKFPLVGHGGDDGLAIVKQILSLYIPKLTPNGVIDFLGVVLGLNGEPVFVQEFDKALAEYADCSGYIILTSKYKLKPGNSLYDTGILRLALNGKMSVDTAYEVMREHFVNIGADEAYCYFCRIQKTSAQPGQDRLVLINVAKQLYTGDITRTTSWHLPS